MGAKVYEKQGFVIMPQRAERTKIEHSEGLNKLRQALNKTANAQHASRIEPATLSEVLALDLHAFGAERNAVLEAILKGTSDKSTTARMVVTRDDSGTATGYGIMSYNHAANSMALGPVVADSSDDAIAMLTELVNAEEMNATDDDDDEQQSGDITVSMFLSGQELSDSFAYVLTDSCGFKHVTTLMAMDRRQNKSKVLSEPSLGKKYVCCASPAWG